MKLLPARNLVFSSQMPRRKGKKKNSVAHPACLLYTNRPRLGEAMIDSTETDVAGE